ncbi:hypothetical protein Cni_G03691 [Canna indica]|uniref:CBF1-interacting co-repressor CIR N-terminal domain-containing protein n=1 Tax=Canna indica TaxID=4628 RepID=A0AAQ3JS20_9LILI|nr:hypothetical protein Cni_G03691 [Canna indica]
MEEDVTGSGGRLGKRPSESGIEVDYKTKAGTAWSHSYLNQKPWHPLSYPNQRRKWIAEQTHANRARRTEEVAREFSQEQEFFRQTALFSKKEKEKVEMMKAVSFMYVRPPGYDAESAKAAEVADEQKRLGLTSEEQNPTEGTSSTIPDAKVAKNQAGEKKQRPKDVFGRPLPTEEEFEVLKNAPRLETGVPMRIKPFGVEVRNVRCVRCGTFGHQSGDRECPLKDVIMPNEESRLKRDDPLTAIMAQTDSCEPLKWELKQKPGMSPPRGGFKPDDPNQQIVAEDIFDEYGGFLGGGDLPLLSNFSAGKSMKHSKHKRKQKHRPMGAHKEHKNQHDGEQPISSDTDVDKKSRRSTKTKGRHTSRHRSVSSSSSDSESGKDTKGLSKSKHKKEYSSSSDSESDEASKRQVKSKYRKKPTASPGSENDKESRQQTKSKYRKKETSSSGSENDKESRQQTKSKYNKKHRRQVSSSPGPHSYRESCRDPKRNPKERHWHEPSSSDNEVDREGPRKSTSKHKKRSHLDSNVHDDYDSDQHRRRHHSHRRKHRRHHHHHHHRDDFESESD